MTTKALERLVIPALDPKFAYEIVEDIRAVLFLLQGPDGLLQCAVLDVENLKVLSIEVWNIVAFEPGDATPRNLAIEFNGLYPGKFCPDDQGRVDYKLEFLYTEETTLDEFKNALGLGLAVALERYESWMRARWSERPRQAHGKDPSRRSKSVEALIEEALHGE